MNGSCVHAVLTGAALILVLAYAPPNGAARARGTAGAIEGRVTFEGAPPAPTAVIEAGSSQPVLYVDRTSGLQYAVVFLPDARAGGTPPKTPATMNQRQFIFEPQVLAVRAGQPVRFTNDDPANHNVRSQAPNPANAFNIFTGSGAAEPAVQQFVATPPNRPLQLSCDIHPSMIAWIYAFDHGRFTVSGPGGQFRIENTEAVYCLGDLVGYALYPNEVIDRIERDGIPTIMGNYDDGVGFDRDECGCAYRDPEEQRLGDVSLQWTKKAVRLL